MVVAGNEFATDLTMSRLCRDLDKLEDMSIDDFVQLYDQQMTELLDKHCPWVESVVKVNRRCRGLTPSAGSHNDTPELPKEASDVHFLTKTDVSSLIR